MLPYSKRKKQGLRLLMAGHSPQAKCLCEILVQKGIRVNHTDVAWHSPEVMLEDVKGQVAERFWLKISYPQMRMVFAGFTQIVQIQFHLCYAWGPGDARRVSRCLSCWTEKLPK